MPSKQADTQSSDNSGKWSAIWLLSCNDKNAIMTYIGVARRLSLPEDYVRSMVDKHPELFRKGFPEERLKIWREQLSMLKTPPAWLQEIEEASRPKAIDKITPKDVFRNQFRPNPKSPRVPIEVINWGVEHIERLRKAAAESCEESIRRLTGIVMPILSTLVALAAVLSGAYLQVRTINEQRDLKYYEVELKPRQEGYSSFLQSIILAYGDASRKDSEALKTTLRKVEVTYYNIEPFLVGPSPRLANTNLG